MQATVNLRGIFAIKRPMENYARVKEKLRKMTPESKHILSGHAQASRTKIKPCSFHLHYMQIPVNTQTTIRSCRVGLKTVHGTGFIIKN